MRRRGAATRCRGLARGFTLMETMVAVGLLGVALIGVAGLADVSAKGNAISFNATAATALMRRFQEEVQEARLDNSGVDPGLAPAVRGRELDAPASAQSRIQTVGWVDGRGAPATPEAAMFRITYRVGETTPGASIPAVDVFCTIRSLRLGVTESSRLGRYQFMVRKVSDFVAGSAPPRGF